MLRSHKSVISHPQQDTGTGDHIFQSTTAKMLTNKENVFFFLFQTLTKMFFDFFSGTTMKTSLFEPFFYQLKYKL